jgi:triphosphoribosyl-dephospho-CoA synthase
MTFPYTKTKINRKDFSYKISILAVKSLYKELSISYKPGLVSFKDSGSHKDMDAQTFIKSIFSLRTYFKKITFAGTLNQDFSQLQILGLEAEKKMFRATKGINTHKGTIFSLGILCAAAGLLYSKGITINSKNLSNIISQRWEKDILHNNENIDSNGLVVKKKYGYKGARFEAANGFLTIMNIALPSFKSTFNDLKDENSSLMQTLFILMKDLDDTNILHRRGEEGLRFVKNISLSFLEKGGVFHKNWQNEVKSIHNKFISKNLSPGGSADLLALCYFVYKLEKEKL